MIAARLHRRRTMTRPRPEAGAGAQRGDVIPYDYGATFDITGRPGNVVQSVINTAPDSLFVAVAVGYGFEEDRGRPLSFSRVGQPAGCAAWKHQARRPASQRFDRGLPRKPALRTSGLP